MGKMYISVKKMNPEHIDSIVEIERAVFPTPWSENSFYQEIQSVYSQSFVAVMQRADSEKVVGYLSACCVYEECTINRIACHYHYRNKGIGSMLLEHLIRHAHIHGAKIFPLEVRESNRAAVALYEKFGFVRVGARKRYYTGPPEDALVMVLYGGKITGMSAREPEAHKGLT